MNSFYTQDELQSIGFQSIGQGCQISRKASFYNTSCIAIGDNVRIDDFCILSGKIRIGSHIHIGAYVALYGAMEIEMEDFTGISARTTIYSAMDDFSGDYMIGPIHPVDRIRVTGGKVILRRYCQIGAHCLIFPNLEIGEGAVVGACSMVRYSLAPWGVYYGIPVERKSDRKKGVLSL